MDSAVPTYDINIITVDRTHRNRENYLHRTMASLVRSGLFDRHDFVLRLWVDGAPASDYLEQSLALVPSMDRVRVHQAPEQRGVYAQVSAVMHHGADTGSPFILLLEDDIIVVHDWLGAVDRWNRKWFEHSRYPVASFAAMYHEVLRVWVATGERVGWWKYPAHKFYGTQCILVRPRHAREIAELVDTRPFRGFPDTLINQYWAGRDFLASVPNFAQHIGLESAALDDPGIREVPCFPGEDWTWVADTA